MSRQKLFCDFDSTLVNSLQSFVSTYNHIYRNNPKFIPAIWDKVERYDMRDQCTLLNNSSEVLELFENYILFKKLKFINNNTYEILKKLNEKYQIIVTSIGTPINLALKAKWLKESLPFIKDYILLYNGNCKMDKSIVDMENGILIDDVSSNLFSSNAERKICFGRRYQWNKDWDGERCFDWTEVERKLL